MKHLVDTIGIDNKNIEISEQENTKKEILEHIKKTLRSIPYAQNYNYVKEEIFNYLSKNNNIDFSKDELETFAYFLLESHISDCSINKENLNSDKIKEVVSVLPIGYQIKFLDKYCYPEISNTVVSNYLKNLHENNKELTFDDEIFDKLLKEGIYPTVLDEISKGNTKIILFDDRLAIKDIKENICCHTWEPESETKQLIDKTFVEFEQHMKEKSTTLFSFPKTENNYFDIICGKLNKLLYEDKVYENIQFGISFDDFKENKLYKFALNASNIKKEDIKEKELFKNNYDKETKLYMAKYINHECFISDSTWTSDTVDMTEENFENTPFTPIEELKAKMNVDKNPDEFRNLLSTFNPNTQTKEKIVNKDSAYYINTFQQIFQTYRDNETKEYFFIKNNIQQIVENFKVLEESGLEKEKIENISNNFFKNLEENIKEYIYLLENRNIENKNVISEKHEYENNIKTLIELFDKEITNQLNSKFQNELMVTNIELGVVNKMLEIENSDGLFF